MKFRKRNIVVEAFQLPLDGNFAADKNFVEWAEKTGFAQSCFWSESGYFCVKTPDGNMESFGGDWVIQGIMGEFYVCKEDVFERDYEPAPDECLTMNSEW